MRTRRRPKWLKRVAARRAAQVLVCGVLAAAIVLGCRTTLREEAPPRQTPAGPTDQPPDQEAHEPLATPAQESGIPPQSEPAEPPAPPDPHRAESAIETLADPQQGWLQITGQMASGRPSSAEGRFRPAAEFFIENTNVAGFTIDRSALPLAGATRLIMHIDGQNLVVFPKEGRHITFERSRVGTWEYVKP